MFQEEAKWIYQCLEQLSPSVDSCIANVGSSNERFRKVLQPHIYTEIFEKLEQKKIAVVHIDQKPDQGVDIIADVTGNDNNGQMENRFSIILCNNLLEHVTDTQLVCKNLIHWCKREGYILLTVPYRYPKHLDPIDNMLRPRPVEIAAFFSSAQTEMIEEKIITINSLENYPVKQSSYPFWGYRNRIRYFLGIRYQVSGLLIKIVDK